MEKGRIYNSRDETPFFKPLTLEQTSNRQHLCDEDTKVLSQMPGEHREIYLSKSQTGGSPKEARASLCPRELTESLSGRMHELYIGWQRCIS